MNERSDRSRDRRSPATRGWMAALTGAGPAGPDWQAGRWPAFTRFAIRGLLITIVVVGAMLLLAGG